MNYNGNVRLSWEEFTPTTAKQALETIILERGLRPSWVRQFSIDMKEGRWGKSPEPIIFDSDGHLIDGQHRLQAIIESGLSQTFLVVRGWDAKEAKYFGCPHVRTAADAALYDGQNGVTRAHIQGARAMMIGFCRRMNRPTTFAVLDFYKEHIQAVNRAVELLGTKERGTSRAGVVAAFARAHYHEPHPGLLERGAHLLRTSLPQDGVFHAGDTSMLLLGRYIVIPTIGGDTGLTTYAKTERALRALFDGKDLHILKATNEELFPLPSEVRI